MKKLLIIAILLTGCSTVPTVNTLPSGAWTVKLPAIIPAWTPSQNVTMREDYFNYYAAVKANLIGCPRYARRGGVIERSVDERTYLCAANGRYVTADQLSRGRP